ncbi:MAG: hypothetical protein CFE21_09375 [Bacteroidetes bacterium B1(2017)]|nr:MAG: hypothetical protein CFE21_09375 [Bacteroidetes bacterium B1(2017)]
MKIAKTLSETILPISIGTALFISFFYAKDRISIDPELESCERNELSTAVYLIFGFGMVVISSLYELVIGNWIVKRNGNMYLLNLANSIVFGSVFPILFIGMEIYNRKEIDIRFYIGFYLVMVLVGLIFWVLKGIFKKYSKGVIA